MHIILYGPSGAGKTTVGKFLAVNLNLPFVDLDAEIERAAGQSIPDIMTEKGENFFGILKLLRLNWLFQPLRKLLP